MSGAVNLTPTHQPGFVQVGCRQFDLQAGFHVTGKYLVITVVDRRGLNMLLRFQKAEGLLGRYRVTEQQRCTAVGRDDVGHGGEVAADCLLGVDPVAGNKGEAGK